MLDGSGRSGGAESARRRKGWALWGVLALVAACGSASTTTPSKSDYTNDSVPDAAPGAGGGDPAGEGLPCDVAATLSARCITCHSNPPVGGAPMPLVTYADLTASSQSDPSKSYAELCLTRMKSTTAPMPPAPAAPASSAEIASFEAWATAGAPMGTCGGLGSGGAAATTAAATTSASAGSGGGGPAGEGLPCDVAAMLTTYCVACHSSPPVGGAPMPLLTYANLTAPSKSDPSKSYAEVCVTRMKSTVAPMPPAPATPPPATAIASFTAWANSGAPMGTCGGVDAGTNPFDGPSVCTSNKYNSSPEGATMQPGRACITCHATSGGEAPTFSIAGTVYDTPHEPNNCVAQTTMAPAITTAVVEITDKNGNVVDLKVNASGNFSLETSIVKPFTAKVKYNGQERMMATPQTSGDCNSCHTQDGANNAPGRVLLP